MTRHPWLKIIVFCLALAFLSGSALAGIHITKAEYGAKGQWRDCTKPLQARCDGGADCAITVDNNICGDPYPGQGKSLVITYECSDGRVRKVQAEEGGILNLNCAAATGRTEALNIISAGYGAPGAWIDVTDKLKNSCQGRVSCSVQAANDYTSQDPAPGRVKQLVVDYQCGTGLRRQEKVRENQWLKLGCENLAPVSLQIQVIEARYGAQGRYNDATQSVRSLCRDQGKCSVQASNKLAGDPYPGVAKELIVTYSCGGRQLTVRAEEGQWADLSCREDGGSSGSSDSGGQSNYQPSGSGSGSGGTWSSGTTDSSGGSPSGPSGPSSSGGSYTGGSGG